MKEITTIQGAWSDAANGWVSEILELTGDAWLEVELPAKGRLVIKKAESIDGPWPKALITKWAGPKFRIRIYGSTEHRYIKVVTTDTPITIQIANI
jgi:hypothetical protein